MHSDLHVPVPDVSDVLLLAGEDLPALPAVEHPAPPLYTGGTRGGHRITHVSLIMPICYP
jgi:hypothetical protein